MRLASSSQVCFSIQARRVAVRFFCSGSAVSNMQRQARVYEPILASWDLPFPQVQLFPSLSLKTSSQISLVTGTPRWNLRDRSEPATPRNSVSPLMACALLENLFHPWWSGVTNLALASL